MQAPTISGTPSQGQTLHVEPGHVDGRAADHVHVQLAALRQARATTASQQAGFNDDAYVLRDGDVGKTIRARVNARNSRGDGSAAHAADGRRDRRRRARPGVITLPNGEKSIPVTSVPSNERLVVDQVTFSPNPIRSRTEPITVRVKVKDTRGFVVRDALSSSARRRS